VSCGCIVPVVPDTHAILQPYVEALVPSALTDLVNTGDVGGSLYRTGGTGGTEDAYGFTTNYVAGTGCGYWEYRQFFDDLTTNNNIFVFLIDEFGNNSSRYGHLFNNFFGLQRVGKMAAGVPAASLFYGPTNGDPDQVGRTVGFRFCIYYDNGSLWLSQNVQNTTDTNDFENIFAGDAYYTGLPTDRRYRIKIEVVPDIAEMAHSPLISETIPEPSDVCVSGTWNIPPFTWAATATVRNPPPLPAVNTVRFDEGTGSSWYLIPPVTDSGNELRSKVVKSMRATGRLSNASMKAYAYDINDEINVADLEAGTNATTRAQDLPDSTQVAQSPRKQINAKNAVLHTVRLEGDDTGQAERNEIHEIVAEIADEGVRR